MAETKPKSTTQSKPKSGTQTKPKTATKTKPKTSAQSKPKTTKSTTSTASSSTPKKTIQPRSKTVKKVEKPEKMTDTGVKPVQRKKTATKKKTTKKAAKPVRIKDESELTTLEVLEAKVDGKPVVEKQPLGRVFYLVFSVVFYAIAFFYINSNVYDGGDYIQSAIFAFAALFIAFVLMLFNIHKMVFYFFVLPFRRLLKQAKAEANKEIIYSVGKNTIQTTFHKYRSIFTLVIYILFGGLLITASVLSSITNGDAILDIIYSAVTLFLIYVVVINSWQFLFFIIPNILEKSIDAKNGYVLTLSAAVIVFYVVFLIFDINYLSELMIFILIIGFVALLGVNLNMIVGEINIFQNLRGRKSKVVTRVVFTIFFGFHIYVIVYASVVAFSIYNWNPDAFVFNEVNYDLTFDDEIYANGILVEQVYDSSTDEVEALYDAFGEEITIGVDDEGYLLTNLYFEDGSMAFDFYDNTGAMLGMYTDSDGNMINNPFFYNGRLAVVESKVQVPNTYSDFLYWTVISVSTIGYGDIAPSNQFPIAQGWGAFLGMYGLTFFALSISFVSNIAMEGVQTAREEHKQHDQ